MNDFLGICTGCKMPLCKFEANRARDHYSTCERCGTWVFYRKLVGPNRTEQYNLAMSKARTLLRQQARPTQLKSQSLGIIKTEPYA